jgi:hypothetical protein
MSLIVFGLELKEIDFEFLMLTISPSERLIFLLFIE